MLAFMAHLCISKGIKAIAKIRKAIAFLASHYFSPEIGWNFS